MKEAGLFVFLVLGLGCANRQEKPIWLNPQSPIEYPTYSFRFKSKDTNWYATLISFTQPISLIVKYEKNGFSLHTPSQSGIIEGPAQLCLSYKENFYYYPVKIVNRIDSMRHLVDFRSPKTVNSDSSLNHQSIIYFNDRFQNLKRLEDSSSFFLEKEITLDPKAKTYRAIENIPLTSYYVQAGSCASIPLGYLIDNTKNQLQIKAGPLYDRYKNLVAEGSLIRFVISDSTRTYQMESLVHDGYAEAKMPFIQNRTYSLYAYTNNVKSQNIIISSGKKTLPDKNEKLPVQAKKVVLSKPTVKKMQKIKPDTTKRTISRTMEIY
jgi:hypothetical protein